MSAGHPARRSIPFQSRLAWLASVGLVSGGFGLGSVGGAAPLLTGVQGVIELQEADGPWRPQPPGPPLELGRSLRTGTGRAELTSGTGAPGGQVVVGSASQLRRYLDEADLQSGRFLLRGPVAVHVQGQHVVMDQPGAARVDLSGATRRVAVLRGELRIAWTGGQRTVRAGQQFALGSGALTAFRETDPWYLARFRGEGEASVQATRGLVELQEGARTRLAIIGDSLTRGLTLSTGAGAWAEVGFSGGGYLRLQQNSALNVLGIERTSAGREVLLQLTRGSAWNVAQPAQGGYRLDTPLVTTAVRGTVFRADASGLVKVFEGQVALPSSGDQPVAAGQQREPGGAVRPLVTDATDEFNLARDAARRQPLTLRPTADTRLGTLALSALSGEDALLSASVDGRSLALAPDASGAAGLYRPGAPLADLPEGQHRVQVTAQRYGVTLRRTQLVTIDRTPPTLTVEASARVGRLLGLDLRVADALSRRVTVRARVGPAEYTRRLPVGDSARWWLPLPSPGVPVTLRAEDAAGNQGAPLDLP